MHESKQGPALKQQMESKSLLKGIKFNRFSAASWVESGNVIAISLPYIVDLDCDCMY